ncbi:hypothetical protein SAMN04487948_1165 [Halogranum amylolyticum]|uniref:Uncharacterized protein n=1 Tax=Halogranum amylolyticum TaxID=660520 RepID=A0A1H8VED5_9EURY|nr:hypothetical protein SAMN04487948_1165 [Halogranum amylolyticum]
MQDKGLRYTHDVRVRVMNLDKKDSVAYVYVVPRDEDAAEPAAHADKDTAVEAE